MSNPATVGNVLTNLFSSYEPKTKMFYAPQIKPESWLNDPEYVDFVKGYEYAATQTRAITVLAKISPEDAYFIYYAIKRGIDMASVKASEIL